MRNSVMEEIEKTEAPRSVARDILIYVALAAVAVLAVIVNLWLANPPKREQTHAEAPWDLALTSALMPEADELTAIRSLACVERAEVSDGRTLRVWVSGLPEDRAGYEETVSAAEAELEALTARQEAARVEKLQNEATARAAADPAELAALAAEQESLDAESQRLKQQRQRLDEEQAALAERERKLSAKRSELDQCGSALNETAAQLDGASREEAQRYAERRNAWYLDGEDYLDETTLFERERSRLDRAERDYAAALDACETGRQALELRRAELASVEPVEIGDCSWRLSRNPDAGKEPEPPAFSPLRLALRIQLLAVAALAAWFFFAKLLSAAARGIAEPGRKTGLDSPKIDETEETEGTVTEEK